MTFNLPQTTVVLVTDEKYYCRALKTIQDVRHTGKWKGLVQLITLDFDMPPNDYDIIELKFPKIDTTRLVQRIGAGFSNSDGRELKKLYQWEKLHVFDEYFKKWSRVIFLDAGLRVFDSFEYLLELDYKGSFLCPNDQAYNPVRDNQFKSQISYDNIELVNKLVNDYGDILDSPYFLNCIWVYDTEILNSIHKEDFIDVMNHYPLFKTNEMGAMNVILTFKMKYWKPFPEKGSNGKYLFEWSDYNRPGTNCRDYCLIKYPSIALNDLYPITNTYECLHIDYLNNSSELCEIGKKYDTDKSSQRNNVTDVRHCHPYTLFYDGLFKNKRDAPLRIAELGILDGASILMWKEYFTNSEIYGFEYNTEFINNFKQNFNNDRISLYNINVTNTESIRSAFDESSVMYDIIIEDTTHQFEDQIRVIENVYQYLKPGGILIIEDIFKSYNENDYINRLTPILEHFQDYYFIELDHVNKNSTGWNNDKLLVFVKGGEPIFKNTNKITIITPSYRVDNLLEIKKSIKFEYVDEWIIVYDGSKITDNPHLFENQEKIKEYVCNDEGKSGNPQRNYALNTITNPETLLYYLDDDNIIHPNLYKLLKIIDNKMYTFNQCNRLKGNNIAISKIDTAMVIIPYKLCKNVRWILDRYEADGYYIIECYKNNTHIFIDNDLCYYNKIGI